MDMTVKYSRIVLTLQLGSPGFASISAKWGGGDLNPDALRHKILSLARLPIPTPPLGVKHDPMMPRYSTTRI
jgi:hypothetical protein